MKHFKDLRNSDVKQQSRSSEKINLRYRISRSVSKPSNVQGSSPTVHAKQMYQKELKPIREKPKKQDGNGSDKKKNNGDKKDHKESKDKLKEVK